jgi:succinate-semialdehyde dehydrogenase / glutarate-semialdehyde dehydrogenase
MSHQVRNPRTGENDYSFHILDEKEVSDICNRLKNNQTRWHTEGVGFRIKVIQDWKIVLAKYQEFIIEALTIDTGRRSESVLEMQILLSSIDRWCATAESFFSEKIIKPSAVLFGVGWKRCRLSF